MPEGTPIGSAKGSAKSAKNSQAPKDEDMEALLDNEDNKTQVDETHRKIE